MVIGRGGGMMPSDHRSSRRVTGASQPTLSIRARLMVLAILAVAPLLGDRIRLLEADRAERVAAAHVEAVGLARRGVEAQQEIVIAARAVLQVVSRAHAT